MVFEVLGAGLVLATMWAALQFEGTPAGEGGAASDESGGSVSAAASAVRIPGSRTTQFGSLLSPTLQGSAS